LVEVRAVLPGGRLFLARLVTLAVLGVVLAVGLAEPGLAQAQPVNPLPTDVKPTPPPGVGQAAATILSWLWWLAGMGIAGGFAWGAFNWARGDVENGKKYITWSLLAFIALAFFYYVTSGLLGG
jgi:phage tail protein X